MDLDNFVGIRVGRFQFVGETEVFLLVDEVSNHIVVSNALSIGTHETFVHEQLTIVVDCNDVRVRDDGDVKKHIASKGQLSR